jgi:hypothetical protein
VPDDADMLGENLENIEEDEAAPLQDELDLQLSLSAPLASPVVSGSQDSVQGPSAIPQSEHLQGSVTLQDLVMAEQQLGENIPPVQAQIAQPLGGIYAADQENPMAIDPPEFLLAMGQQLIADHNIGPVNQQFNVNINMALTNVVFSGADPLVKTPPDVFRLWAKHFSPVGCPSHVIQIPKDWAAFFTVMLLSPTHFDWAKSFLSSQAWNMLLQCSNSSSFMSFALPSSCPENAEVRCAALEAESEDISSQQGSNSAPPISANSTKVKPPPPTVETEARRSPRIRSKNGGFRHISCPSKNCLACAATPPSLAPNVLSRLGKDLCKISEENLSLDSLSSKGKGKSVIGGKRGSKGSLQSKVDKGTGSCSSSGAEVPEDQEAIKKFKK